MAKRSSKTQAPPKDGQAQPAEGLMIFSAESVRKWKLWLKIAVIAAAVFAIYQPVIHGDWLWDDDVDITANSITQSPTGLWKIWFEPGSQDDYYPIKASVQWLEWKFWHNHTLGYHLTNILLHLVCALLVWQVLGKFKLRFAWLGGLIFAVHPVNVESVAWIAELKNTLSLAPFLLAMGDFIDYDEQGRRGDYLRALGFFLLAMLTKTTMVMFPVVILLYAWWKRGRVGWTDLKVSAPFFAISLILGWITLWCGTWYSQRYEQPQMVLESLSLFSHLALGGAALAFYVLDFIWPMGLLPVYPQWDVGALSWLAFLPWFALAGLFGWFWHKRESWGRHAVLGLGFFFINLAPFLGFKLVAYMRMTWVMDHFLYIPMIGLIGLVVAGFGMIYRRLTADQRIGVSGLVMVVLLVLAWGSRSYAGNFTGQEALWNYTLQYNPNTWVGYNNRGNAWAQQGRTLEAKGQYEQALRLHPDYEEAHNNLGNMLVQLGQYPEAAEQYRAALRLNPNSATANNNLGLVMRYLGHPDEAIAQYEKALKIAPNYAAARYNLGNVLLQLGRFDEAIAQYREEMRLEPEFAEGRSNLAYALNRVGRYAEALEQGNEALKSKPDLVEAHDNLGIALANLGRYAEAEAQFTEALRINPNDAHARKDLEMLHETLRNAAAKK
jgi:tetratricopeptide (TPR) repeat protein